MTRGLAERCAHRRKPRPIASEPQAVRTAASRQPTDSRRRRPSPTATLRRSTPFTPPWALPPSPRESRSCAH